MNEHRGRQTKDGIRIYDPSDFAGMHTAGKLAAQILDDIDRRCNHADGRRRGGKICHHRL